MLQSAQTYAYIILSSAVAVTVFVLIMVLQGTLTPFALLGLVTVVVFLMVAPSIWIYQMVVCPQFQEQKDQLLLRCTQDGAGRNCVIQQRNHELLLLLSKIFAARDPYVGNHASQVATYAVAIAIELKLPLAQLEILRQSAYLHDIGKIGIPDIILHKPARLTDQEYQFMQRHVEIGADFVSTSQGLEHLAPFIRYHHERWDGLGYPAGLAGEEIPLEARILSLCDAVEAMASDRPYHRAIAPEQIVAELKRCSGKQFDPTVVAAFIRIFERQGARFIINSAQSVTRQLAATKDADDSSFSPLRTYSYGMQPLHP
ncbi:MAG: HD-GYP domain-containing protein [Caldilineaceae bacterium]